jgi:hypothetical protein
LRELCKQLHNDLRRKFAEVCDSVRFRRVAYTLPLDASRCTFASPLAGKGDSRWSSASVQVSGVLFRRETALLSAAATHSPSPGIS